ncbi:MAG: hypothetical protein H0T46_22540 [Deltaproteobacteria bacterium]|nr:hypothetical protein [Deltaproteobacteria bacterium]
MSSVTLRRLLAALTLTTACAPAASAAPCSEHPDLSDLEIDAEHIDKLDAAAAIGRQLAAALSEMRPLGATQLASTWALSEHQLRRLAVAHALEWTFKLVGDDLIIDHLSRDPDREIRKEVARAAWVRRAAGGDPGVLARLAEDPDPEVRAIAARATT